MSSPKVQVKVWGNFACWTRPENKVERVSYECMTPSAARNILDAICWRPEMRWVPTKISVLKPILFHALKRNEVQSKISPASIKKWMADPSAFTPMVAGAGTDEGTQRNTLALKDVAYVIEAYPHVFEPTAENTPVKYMAMFNRRVEKGQCFHRPSLGLREFAADFAPVTDQDLPIDLTMPVGKMLYDIVFRKDGNRALFFDAELKNGILSTDPEIALSDPNLRKDLLTCSYKR
jgi:CRISPR-associated protein Cas5d